jgi:hypothetical protein
VSTDLYTVSGEVSLIQFQAKYPRFLAIHLNVPNGVRSHYGLVPGQKVTVDGKETDHAGLIAWANEMPPEGKILAVHVEMKVCDHDYVGVHEAHFTARVRE